MTLPHLNHDAYTVGWVCALRCEVNASRAMLDEEHERLPRAPNDDNSYILGQAGKHNVVIAFPGAGVHGTEAAARTTAHMIRTFRNIRFGLMVGIGGGAPKSPDPADPANDIRLGDVVVGESKGRYGTHLSHSVDDIPRSLDTNKKKAEFCSMIEANIKMTRRTMSGPG